MLDNLQINDQLMGEPTVLEGDEFETYDTGTLNVVTNTS